MNVYDNDTMTASADTGYTLIFTFLHDIVYSLQFSTCWILRSTSNIVYSTNVDRIAKRPQQNYNQGLKYMH